MLKFKVVISLLIWIGGWTLCVIFLDVSGWFALMIPLSVGLANLFLEKSTQHDNDIDVLRDRKLKEILG